MWRLVEHPYPKEYWETPIWPTWSPLAYLQAEICAGLSPTSLHQTRMSTSWVMSLVLSASDICGDLPPEVDSTVCAGDTIMHNKRQQSDVLQSFSVTSTRGRREAYLLRTRKHQDVSRYSWNRRSQWAVRYSYCRCIFYNRTGSGRTHRWNTDTERGEDITNGRILVPLTHLWRLRLPYLFRFAHLAQVLFFCGENLFFFKELATITGGIVDVWDTLTSDFMFSWMCVRWVGW